MKTILFFYLSCLAFPLFADSVAYGGRHSVTAERGDLRIVHTHDWNSPKVAKLFLDLAHHEAFLSEKNDFSYIEAWDQKGILLFRRPASALSYLWISPDSKFIVGLSSVKLYNPFQIMVWKSDGTLIYKEHISPSVAKLPQDILVHFREKFPSAAEFLSKRSSKIDDTVYIDYSILGVPNEIGSDAWRFLSEHSVPHPYSPDFSSSVTNWVGWYDERNPRIRIEENQHQTAVILTSPRGKSFRIPLVEKK